MNRRNLQESAELIPAIEDVARLAFPTQVAPGPTDEEIEAYRQSLGDWEG